MGQTRQLAAIMFTDIVGYTALMGEDEQEAFGLLHRNRQIQKPLIEKFHGRWIKELGDGVLASFPAVTEAVACACSIIKACETVPGLKLRIGIHLGEVVVEDDDVFGDGVNIASRLQAIAPIGGILISETVQNNISNKKGIVTHFVKEEILKHVKEPIRVYEVETHSFIQVEFQPYQAQGTESKDSLFTSQKKPASKIKKEWKGITKQIQRSPGWKVRRLLSWSIPVLGVLLYTLFSLPSWINKRKAKNEIIPQIRQLASSGGWLTPTKAFDLAKKAEKYIPNDSDLIRLWPDVARPFTFITYPEGASVMWKDYNDIKGDWKLIGTTPLTNAWIPRSFIRLKIEKAGFAPVNSPEIYFNPSLNLKLDSLGKLPSNMMRVNGATSFMLIVGLEKYEGRFVDEFLIDKYEVTNREYKRFVNAGGYREKKYWDYPIIQEGKEQAWEKAMESFHDKTGKPGPASWEVGTFPDGKAEDPVTGVSWYEAMAFAKFAGKTLPTVFHWSRIADTWNTIGILPRSNFNGMGTVPVGSLDGISSWGVYDIAGNAREWCMNESNNKDMRYILGGGWNDPTYAYNDAYTQHASDRSLSNGFRCMIKLARDTGFASLCRPLQMEFRDYNTEKPVDDVTFNILLRQYAYDHSPLNPDEKIIFDSTQLRVEKITIEAAYNKEKLMIYLYTPKQIAPPYQTIVYFPGSNVINERVFNFRDKMKWDFKFILQSGRAVAMPIIKGTFERGDDLHSDLQDETVFYKEHVIDWIQDFNRSIDYLETRKDILHNNYGFYGLSWGSAMSPVVCAVENRIKAAVLNVGGLMMGKTMPEVDPINFLPRVKIPVLMLNGKNDTFFPIETSQKPMFRLLGTKAADKKMISYEGGHIVPQLELMREAPAWFDKYLGQVK